MTIDDRKRRWLRFYHRAQPVSYMLLINLESDGPGRPGPHPDKQQDRVDWAWGQYCEQMDRATWLDDDFLPHLDVYTGTEVFAEAFGCAVHRPEDDMPFALPFITTASEVSKLPVPDLDTPCLRMLFEMADRLRSRAGSAALLKMVDIQSPMDIAALIWEKSAFYMALVEAPEAVRELADKTKQLLMAFLDEWFARYGVAHIAHYPHYYVPKGMTLSADEIGCIDNDAFEAFFFGELAELSERYGAIGVHCCAHARHQWPSLKRVPGLMLLNLVQPDEVLRDAYAYFADAVPQMHSWCGDGDPLSWPGQLPADCRAIFQVPAESKAEAIELATAFGKKMKRF